jgi:hypothetical protein
MCRSAAVASAEDNNRQHADYDENRVDPFLTGGSGRLWRACCISKKTHQRMQEKDLPFFAKYVVCPIVSWSIGNEGRW